MTFGPGGWGWGEVRGQTLEISESPKISLTQISLIPQPRGKDYPHP